MDKKELCFQAANAMRNSYAPYSGFRVGAALLCRDGTVFTGCNIENASFTPTVCAERTAIFKAVSEGHRDFVMMAVCGGKNGALSGYFPPCGVCRQVLAEFCSPDFTILIMAADSIFQEVTLAEILPFSFNPRYMKTED